jgi:hypothetical protein
VSQRCRNRHHEHPERVGEDLDAIGDVPAQAETVQEVVDGSEGDVGVVADPGRPNQQLAEEQAAAPTAAPLEPRPVHGPASRIETCG